MPILIRVTCVMFIFNIIIMDALLIIMMVRGDDDVDNGDDVDDCVGCGDDDDDCRGGDDGDSDADGDEWDIPSP